MNRNECICICISMHNNASTISKALNSVFMQEKINRKAIVIVSDDNSTDGSREIVKSYQATYENVILLENNFNNVSQNRNALQQYVLQTYPECILMGRLDADDTIAETDILQRIEKLWDSEHFDVLLMANYQIKNGHPTGYINQPDNDLLDWSLLTERLDKMASGSWEAELPSCNVFVRPQIAEPYPDENSAEDHWSLVNYMLRKDELKIIIKSNWIYCNYNIDGALSQKNRKDGERITARKELYKHAFIKAEELQRKATAFKLLSNYQKGSYHYLGAGFSGVVFHNESWIYKVHLPLASNNFNEVDNILYLKEKLRAFDNRTHFFPLRDLIEVEGYYILIYPYKQGMPVTEMLEEEMISFLSEMWEMKLMCRSITKENNFIRVDGVLKLIDYEIEPYNDNLFLNLAARAFIQLNNYHFKNINYNKLKRSTINNFQFSELNGFSTFVHKVFNAIASKQIQSNEPTLDKLNPIVPVTKYNGVNNPSVSLLIKACIQDSASVINDVKFMLAQLPKAVAFKEIVLLIDTYRADDFLRQYTDKGSHDELIIAANQLAEEGVIHKVMMPPNSQAEIEAVNARWFGRSTAQTHSKDGVPVTSQIFAFEEIEADYIFQLDEDILLGCFDDAHDFLQKPIEALQSTPNAISWGVPIYLGNQKDNLPFVGDEGSIAPDPRACLIDRKRLLQQLPLENEVLRDGWALTWYRALERKHQSGESCSLRGGHTKTFYVHPQNYRKENRWVWWTLMEACRNKLIPEKQAGHNEIVGNIFDWTLPKRKESLIVVLLLDAADIETTRQSVFSILSQDYNDFGLVVYNNTADLQITGFLSQLSQEIRQRITLIRSENSIPVNEAIFKAIHYYITDENSFVCLMKQGDLLLGKTVFSECMNRLKLYEADVLIGKEFSAFTLSQNGLSASNFIHPRQDPETLLNGLVIFKKYLFDALSHFDLKEPTTDIGVHLPGYTKIKKSHRWLNDTTFLSVVVPVVELSKNPIRFDHYNLLRHNIPTHRQLEEVKLFLLSKKSKTEGQWESGRKTFLPNINRIELDITYDCNLKCLHCNRSCTQAPAQAQMTMEQIKSFVQESIALGKKWEIINVLGGEPTLHPRFDEMIQYLLYQYVIPYSAGTTLQITSNGFGDEVQQKLQALPEHPNLVVNTNSFKKGREIPYFTPFNLAPSDRPDGDKLEYHKGCWVTAYCGIGLNYLGYFACGVAGGIERILHSGQGLPSLAALNIELLQQQLQTFCKLCGNFTDYAVNRGDFMERAEKEGAPKTAMSDTWKNLYKKYNHERN